MGWAQEEGKSKTVTKAIALKKSLACVKCLLQNQNILDRVDRAQTECRDEQSLHYTISYTGKTLRAVLREMPLSVWGFFYQFSAIGVYTNKQNQMIV